MAAVACLPVVAPDAETPQTAMLTVPTKMPQIQLGQTLPQKGIRLIAELLKLMAELLTG
ncbi:MAG TPA: hypothetical protein VLW50_32895 [Streptosporangiaceae bacterium]|nr:hypothetical protein [Streptosporangiaceae bacterium]